MSPEDFTVKPSGLVSVTAEPRQAQLTGIQDVTFRGASGKSIMVQASKKSDSALIYRIPGLGWIARRVMGLFEITAKGETYLVSKKHAIDLLKQTHDTHVKKAVECGGRISHIMLRYLESHPAAAAPADATPPDMTEISQTDTIFQTRLGTLLVRLCCVDAVGQSVEEGSRFNPGALAQQIREGRDISLGSEKHEGTRVSDAQNRVNKLHEFFSGGKKECVFLASPTASPMTMTEAIWQKAQQRLQTVISSLQAPPAQ